MQNPFSEPDPIKDEINRLAQQLKSYPAGSDEYQQISDRIFALSSSRKNISPGVSAETKAMIAANLAGIVLVLAFESGGFTLGSKALGFVSKVKL